MFGLLRKYKTDDGGYEHTIHLNGVHGFIFRNSNSGRMITISGWDDKHWGFNVGDRVLLKTKDGQECRYKFIKVKHCGDPGDMYFADCVFFPRKKSGPAEQGQKGETE